MIRARFLPAWHLFVAAIFAIVPAPSLAGEHGGGHEAAVEETEIEVAPDAERGVEIGEFDIRSFRAVPSQRVRVRFKLYATVLGKEYKHFDHLFEGRKNKAREQVLVATRLVPVEDYNEADLKTLRRQILLRLRRTMPELAIDDVVVSEFALSVEGT